MSMRLAKNNAAAFNYYSEGDNTNPIRAAVTLDGAGGTKVGNSVDPIYVIFENDTGGIATISGHDDNPTGPLVAMSNEQAGINWELSADGATGWAESLTLNDQSVSGGAVAIRIYARCTVVDDGSIAVNNYTQAKFNTKCKQEPAA